MLRRRLLEGTARSQAPTLRCRFSTRAYLESGHNRWSKIKHDKGKKDAGKSRERTSITIDLIQTSKEGGPDPKLNTALAFAINNAKRAQISKEAIEKAIAKGQGKSLSGAALDPVLIEAMLPYGVAAIMEGSTENKTRILADVKSIVQRAGGSFSPTAFSFERKGKIWFKQHATVSLDEVMDVAIDSGAEEIIEEDGQIIVETAPENLLAVQQLLKSTFQLEVERSQVLYDPKEETLAKLDEEQVADIQTVVERLDDLDDIQDVYINAV